VVLAIEQGRRADQKQKEQRNDHRRNDPLRGAKARHGMLLVAGTTRRGLLD